MSLRSVPRQIIVPDRDTLTKLKHYGILKYRGERAGRRKLLKTKTQEKLIGEIFHIERFETHLTIN